MLTRSLSFSLMKTRAMNLKDRIGRRWVLLLIMGYTIFTLFVYPIGHRNNSMSLESIDKLGSTLTQLPRVYNFCIEADLDGTKNSAGHGNVAFELLVLYSIAQRVKRNPIIRIDQTRSHLLAVLPHFPNLLRYFDNVAMSSNCMNSSINLALNHCCRHDAQGVKAIEDVKHIQHRTIALRIFYTQSFKYFQHFSLQKIRELLEAPEYVKEMAMNDLFPADSRRSKRKNICVHIRRGDFVNNKISLPSNEVFIKAALKYIISKEIRTKSTKRKTRNVFIMSNDNDWSEKQLSKSFPQALFSSNNRSLPPNTEWEFSRLYCDVVLHSASSSTYGWWMGYLSRGQKVYYNSNYSTSNGINKVLIPEDFFPLHWIPLKLTKDNTILQAKRQITDYTDEEKTI